MKKLFLLCIALCFVIAASAQIETVVDTISTSEKFTLVKYTYVQDTLYFDEQIDQIEDELKRVRQESRRLVREEVKIQAQLARIRKQRRKAVRDLEG
jgi:peptidoglycan hydrolase CwlO-like protein